ncbi:MAG: nitronate monooxygenase [Candidatus Hydrogenedentes bacterium]|nr:nitronate monooxygenase [Candidatus Hydrogenedentota bacterium]
MGKPTLKTKFCEIMGVEYPICSAGMGPSLIGERTGATVELVVAVSEAGGVGVLGAAGFTVDVMRDAIREIKKQTDKPFGVDILLPAAQVEAGDTRPEDIKSIPIEDALQRLPKKYYDWFVNVKKKYNLPDLDIEIKGGSTTARPRAAIKAIIEEEVPLFCAGLGNPAFMVEDAHKAGVKVMGLTGNTKNARRVAQGGSDFVVAQGHEAGGHTGRIGTLALLPQALDAVGDTPLLAAGGIGDGRALAACLAMGCVGVWVGTRFLATKESGLVDEQAEFIVNATDEDTRRSKLYTGKTSRTIYSEIHDVWEESGLDMLPFGQQGLLASAVIGSFHKAKKYEFVGPFSGQVSGLINDVPSAKEVVEQMVEQAVDILAQKLPETVVAKA